MKDKITPVFHYSAYALEYACGTGEDTEYIIIPVKGYLTDKNLTNVFNWTSQRKKKTELTEAEIYELTQQEEFLYKGKSIVLAKTTFNHLRPFGKAKSVTFDSNLTGQTKLYSSSNEKDAERIRDLGGIEIGQNDLLFPIEQVEDYVDSFICDNEDNALDSFIPCSSTANAKIEQQQKEIDNLKAQLNKANAALADKPARNQKKEKQGDSLLILGAVMHCIKDAAKKNLTQDLLTQTILDRYENVSGISRSTLDKKYTEAKNYLEQRHTP